MRGRKPDRDWGAVIAEAQSRDLSIGQVAREQGAPYGTVASVVKRKGLMLRTDDRKRRWDGIRTADRVKALNNNDNLREFTECGLHDLAQNERLAPALALNEAATVRFMTAPDVVYVIAEEGGAWCKIGISASNDINRRVRELQMGNPRRLAVVFTLQTETARAIEKVAHSMLWRNHAGNKARSEWFSVTAQTAIEAVKAASEDAPMSLNRALTAPP